MNTINLKALATKISIACPVLIDFVSEQTITLKGKTLPYRLYMKFESNLPLLQVDLYDCDLKSEIRSEVDSILKIYHSYIVEPIQISYLNLTY